MTASCFRVLATGLVSVFKSASIVLKQVPTFIRKHKTNIFDKSIKFLHRLFLAVLDVCRLFQMVLGCFRSFLDCFRSFQIVLDRFRLFQLVPHCIKYHKLAAYRKKGYIQNINPCLPCREDVKRPCFIYSNMFQ